MEIIKVITGSHLYGSETPQSDMDYQAVFMPRKQMVYGFETGDTKIIQETVEGQKIDYTSFSLIKYIFLAIQNNPNIIGMLYTPRNRILEINKYGHRLLKARDLFLSKKAYHTFRGYAHAQRQKLLTKNPIGKRLEMIDKYGYDVKFAMHLIRLLYECLDIFVLGEIIYPCTNRGLLKQIRLGEKSLEWVLVEAVRLESLIDEAYVKSSLQHTADKTALEQMQMEMLEEFWSEQDG